MTDLSADLARALDQLPVIPKGAKLQGDKYTAFVRKVLDAHRAGASIREISDRTQRGYGSIQRLIHAEAPDAVGLRDEQCAMTLSADLARALDQLPVIPKGAKLQGDKYTAFVRK
ncbi:helix-turn-helix domain-containing protein, partial [Streptomyces sp. NPDC057552]|uniref:helix-turn-helix domain-containing protein n=1 Tax=Streptomyces sp. NPDC057552 TaxID=3350537 RepID=UPI00367B32DB